MATPQYWLSPWAVGVRNGKLVHSRVVARSRETRKEEWYDVEIPNADLVGKKQDEQQKIIVTAMVKAFVALGITPPAVPKIEVS
jgi:hypothetical protein